MNINHALTLGRELMNNHGLHDWRIKPDRAVRRFGLTQFGTRTISLSAALCEMNDETEVRDVILHEIAHALAGHKAGHGPEWRRVARSIGCTAQRTHDATTPRGNWRGVCPACGNETYRVRMAQGRKYACAKCCNEKNEGRYSELFLMDWFRVRG